MATPLELSLSGPGGERVDLWRTIVSHGLSFLRPNVVDEGARTLQTTVPLGGSRPRTIRIAEAGDLAASVDVLGPPVTSKERPLVLGQVRHMLRLDEDLSPFYESVASDRDLAWAASGSGRMLRSPTVFEDVIKTICTTNCAWSATVRMVTALVENLGEESKGRLGRTFPEAAAMAEADEGFYRETVRAGYRGAYLRALGGLVAEGSVDLEALGRAAPEEITDAEVRAQLLALPGIGPYGAAHVMMLLGRYSELVLDSWTRPTYAGLAGKRKVADSTIVRRFRRYGPYAGLAFWLVLTRDWVADERP